MHYSDIVFNTVKLLFCFSMWIVLDSVLCDSDDYSDMTHKVAEGLKLPHRCMNDQVLNQVDEVRARKQMNL